LGFTPAQTRAKGRDLWNPLLENTTGTVSETVSKRGGGVVKNSGGLKQIVIDFTGAFAILLASDRTFHVAARRPLP
jgi:hypothetical protein